MATWIALLRGVNVGGKHELPMAKLRGELERAGGVRAVRTYIQSGNVVFECARELEKAVAANPLPAACDIYN